MKKSIIPLVGLMLVSLSIPALAQEVPTYYAVYIPDDKIPVIDGDLSDWEWVPEEYVVEGFTGHFLLPPESADDLSATFWFGWNETTNKVYGAIHVHDDHIMVDLHPQSPHKDDSIEIHWDPTECGQDPCYFDPETHMSNTCQFWISAQTTGPQWGIYSAPDPATWWYTKDPKYTKGIGVIKGNEIYYEYYITPYSPISWDSEEQSTLIKLQPLMSVGWQVGVDDADPGLNRNGEDGAVTGDYWQSHSSTSTVWGKRPHVILMPPEEVVVEPASWGLIKMLLR